MMNLKEAVLASSILFASLLIIPAVTGVELPGSSNSNLVCSIPIVSNGFNQCSTDVAERYDLSTSITVQSTDVHANLNEGSFEYETEKANVFSRLSMIGPNANLAFGGVNNVELRFQLEDSTGTTIADGSKYIGELGVFQSEDAGFSADNLEPGEYTVKYRLTYTPDFGVTEGVEQEKNLEKNIRIPKRIE